MALGATVSQSTLRLAVASKLKLVRSCGSTQSLRPTGTSAGGSVSRGEAQPVWNKNQRMFYLV